MVQIVSKEFVKTLIPTGASVMIGGFLKCGTPQGLIEAVIESQARDLTLIANDTCFPDSGRGRLIVEKRVSRAIVSHIGTNSETGRQMHSGELTVELTPQGTLAERIRAGGAGLGGILTPTGVGTVVEKNRRVIEVNGRNFLLEPPLRADVSLIYGTKADRFGNISFTGTTRNFNPVMATASDIVIAEVDVLNDLPLDPNEVIIPGVYVDYIVVKGQ